MDDDRPIGSERRRHTRLVVDLPTHLVIDGRAIGCRLIDVSRGGALVEAPVTVSVGDHVMLQIPGTGNSGARNAVAKVVRATPISFALAFEGTVILSMAGDCDAADDPDPRPALQGRTPRRPI